ncbi:MAG: hypothetical protein KBC72_00485 [Acinetobacter sp.]|nr:hypothetical protein [Acinetobacter sp.]
MTSQYTRGPWQWIKVLGINNLISANGDLVLGCDDTQDQSFIGPNTFDEKLIGAAPELLEALEMVRDADNDCKLDGLQTIPPIARAKIDKAINKARGIL